MQREALDGGERLQQVDGDDVVDFDVVREVPDRRRGLVPCDHDPRLVVLELVAQFPGGVQGVVFDDDRAQAQHRVERDDVLRAVRQDQGHPVARADAEAAQALGGPVHLFAEVGVAGAAAEELQCRRAPRLGHGPLQHVHERLRGQFDLRRDARLVILHPGLLVCFRHGPIIS